MEKDLQLVASVLAHLRSRGRPVTVAEAVADVTLADYDGALARAGASDKTRDSKRGIMRRLQAAHHGAPWRAERRPDGTRAANPHGPQAVAVVAGPLARAQTAGSGDAGAVAFTS